MPIFWLKKIYHWLLPGYCSLCHTTIAGELICTDCLAELPWQDQACPRCGLPSLQNRLCGECLKKPPPYHNMQCLFYYQPPIDKLILALKFSAKLVFARLLGELMAEKFLNYYTQQPKPQLIIPMPLYNQRLQQRGYNQAVEIARPVAKKSHIPLETTYCQRIYATIPQASISASKRKQNVKNAFSVHPSFKAKHVAIIDDVVTTGSTVAALSKALCKNGIERIDAWCCARTPLLHPNLSPNY